MSYRLSAALAAILLTSHVLADDAPGLRLSGQISKPPLVIQAATAQIKPGAPLLPITQAVQQALENQPLLTEKAAAITASEQGILPAGELPDPRLTVGLANVPRNTLSLTEESMTSANIGIEQVIPGGNKRKLNSERARLDTERSSVMLEETRRSITRDAALAWLAWYQPLQAKLLVQALQGEVGKQLEWQRIALGTGKGNLQQVLAIQGTLDLLHDREAELDHAGLMAQTELARWVGPNISRMQPAELPKATVMADFPSLRERLSTHPQLTSLDKLVAATQTEVALAREAVKSDWNVGASYGFRSSGRSDLISVQVARDLPIFPEKRQDRIVSARLAQLEQVRALREDRQRTLYAELEKTYVEWHAAGERLAWFDSTVLPRAAERIEAALANYRSGQGDLGMVLEARRAELDVQLQRLSLSVAQIRGEIQLQYFAQ